MYIKVVEASLVIHISSYNTSINFECATSVWFLLENRKAQWGPRITWLHRPPFAVPGKVEVTPNIFNIKFIKSLSYRGPAVRYLRGQSKLNLRVPNKP